MKKPRTIRVYLDDIADAVRKIETYVRGGRTRFFRDGKTQDAVLYQLAIIGEAAGKLPAGIRSAHPQIAWKEAIGMRNVIIHDYSEVQLQQVWDTVERNIPELKKVVRSILREMPRG